MTRPTRPRTRLKYRWADITTAALVSAATLAFIAAVFERIPA